MALSKEQHFDRTRTPKRILALDGGGVRGILSLQYLGVIENMLRERSGDPKLVLSDYFDLIGGTSTGAILAATLACGKSVDELKAIYDRLGGTVFNKRWYRRGILAPKFPSEPLREALEETIGADTTLGSDVVKTGVMIMTKRLDTGSPWPIHNHPESTYAAQNGALRLTQIVRASTAAPTYFEPECITISSRGGESVRAAFVDGGVSPFNDPALQLLMVASLQGHGFRWRTGADKLLLVSIGTGTYKELFPAQKLLDMPAAEQGLRALASLMDDCARVNHALLQWLTCCQTPWHIDRDVKDMKLDSEQGPNLARYSRYNVLLEKSWLKTEADIDLEPAQLAKLGAMDDASNMAELAKLGATAAAKQIKPEHFPAAFDLR
jgi:hypothetical protein